MLSIQWIQDVDYYLNQATADYYFRPGEPPGRWWGRGAKSLGLAGTVTAEQLKALCKGFSPEGKALIQNAGATDHQQAWDLTFSAPKSVSVLWSQAPREIRLKIRKIHHKAIKAALDYLAEVALLTRRGKGGAVREHAGPIVAVFEHGSSRELEPQLHSHCVMVNVAVREDGTFGTLLSDPFYKHKLTAGAIYRTQLAYLLSELGLEIEREGTAFRVVGVPQKLVDHYSTRRKQIENKLGSKGSHTAKAAATAALDTRKAKRQSPPPRGELFKRWQETNHRFGFTEKQVQQLLGKVAAGKTPPVLKTRIAKAIQDLLETESFFSEQQLIRQVAISTVSEGVSAAQVINQVRVYLLSDPELVVLGPFNRETQFTTREMLALEQELLSAIDHGKDDTSYLIGKSAVTRLLNQRLPLGPQLSADEATRNREQRDAVVKLTTNPGAIQVLEGMAGTGKTYTLSTAREAWTKAGYQVTGMALSAVAAASLHQGAGIESDTIAMRLIQLDGRGDLGRHHKRQLKRLLKGQRTYAYGGRRFRLNRKTIVVVDEAGMVGTRQMVKLLKHVRSAGAKLVLIGDRRQLQPIDAGGPFTKIADRTDKAELNHVVRQQVEPDDPNPTWHREAGKLIAAGAVARAIKLFAERGRFSVLPERDQAMLAIVRDWSVHGISNPTDHVILASTREEVAQLNAMCQAARLSGEALKGDHILVGENQFRCHDSVLFTRNSRLLQVKNGDRGVVLGFNRLTKTMAVRLHTTQKTVIIPYRTYTDIQLGYAMTTHKAQGATVPSLYVLLGGAMQDRHLSYVQLTRACESTRLYVDKFNAGPDLKLLLKQMARERGKLLAHDLLSEGAVSETATPEAPPPSPATVSDHRIAKKPRKARRRKRKQTAQPKSDKLGIAPKAEPTVLPREAALANHQVEQPVPHPEGQNPEPPTDNPLSRSTSQGHSANHHTPLSQIPAVLAPTPTPTLSPRETVDRSGRDTSEDRPELTARTSTETERKAASFKTVQGSRSPDLPHDHQSPITFAAMPASEPEPKLPPRDILDLSHVSVVSTTDVKFLRAAVERYGRLPGGIVIEGDASCPVQITSLTFDPKLPTHLLINGCKVFDTGLSPEEVALIWHAVLETEQGVKDFGALSQRKAIGIDDDTKVGITMLIADNALGGITYGYDSQYNLGKRPGPYHRNPFVEETDEALLPNVIERLFFNYLNTIAPQLFLTVTDVRFSESTPGVFRVASTQVTAALAVATWEQALVTTPLLKVESCFPLVHKALQELVAHFGDHARREPCVARTIAYAELVSLLRRAKTTKASLAGRDHVRRLVAARQRIPLPRFNYTLRSKEFVAVAADAARQLSRTESTWFDGLMATTIGIHYASHAGDFSAFLQCKQHALKCISRLQTHTFSDEYRHLSQALPGLAERIRSCCHDALIEACIEAACDLDCPQEEKLAYLNEAMRLCGSPAMIKQNSPTRCCWLEAKSYLHATFDAAPDFAKVRADDPSTMLPFSTLTRIKARRQHGGDIRHRADRIRFAIEERKQQVGFAKLGKEYADLWLKLKDKLSDRSALWLLEQLQRFGLPLQDYLGAFGTHKTDDPKEALWRLLVARLTHLPATSFSMRLLHCDNPFVASHELLDFESPANLDNLFSPVRQEVERSDFLISQEKSRLRKLLSTFLPLDLQAWWGQFLKTHAASPGSDASKVALLLAYELKVRGRSVKDLYDQMREHPTKNPQAALFLLDLDKATKAAMLAAFEQRNKESGSSN